jgi:hypothetical protein
VRAARAAGLARTKAAPSWPAALAAAGDQGQTEDDIVKVIEWAQQTRMHEYALALVLAGHMGACIRDGELTWKTLP